jgi:hypothetical protein
MPDINLLITPWKLAVCKLTNEQLPAWANSSHFLSYTKTADEYSLVCEAHYVPKEIKAETGWNCLKVEGVLDFSLVGIIAGITAVLAAEKISVFVISTHDTDYLLIKEEKTRQAIQALKSSSYNFMNEYK